MTTRPADFALTYSWAAGSVLPPNHYEYTITVQPSGEGTILFVPDYSVGDAPQWHESFTLTSAQMDALYTTMEGNGLFETLWQPPESPPEGGSSDVITVSANRQTIHIPPYVIDKQEAARETIAGAVRATVPDALWAKLERQRQEYVDHYGK